MENYIDNYLSEVQQAISTLPRKKLIDIVNALKKARKEEKHIFLIGNGGSAATASHFAHDLVKSTVKYGSPRFRAVALSDNVPIITAVANDYSYEMIFVEQLEALGNIGDIVVAFSGSGNSPNIVKAIEWAKSNGLMSIAFTGETINKLEGTANICLKVSSSVMGQIEGIHLMLTQLIYLMLKDI